MIPSPLAGPGQVPESPQNSATDRAIVLVGVSRTYPSGMTDIQAVRGVDFAILSGQVVALTGPSGSGKTTTLNLIAGLDRPTAGEVIVLGQPLAPLSEANVTAFRARSIGIVFQDPHLLPGLTALENVVVASLPWRKRGDLEVEARELLEAVGLEHRVDHPPARLSGGERQRVAIARALTGGRPILLADEPTGNLDSATTDEIVALLGRLRDERGLTIVLATHDPAVAAFADRIVHLVDGRLAGDQTTDRHPVREPELEA